MPKAKGWILAPHSGGAKIPPSTQELVKKRILAHAEKNYAGKFSRLGFKFRGALCYVDAFSEPDEDDWSSDYSKETKEEFMERLRNTPTHLVRMRHFDTERWSAAFYTYSNERYEPCILPSGDWFGTAEEIFDIGAMYLQ
jgi:hypothetical protein